MHRLSIAFLLAFSLLAQGSALACQDDGHNPYPSHQDDYALTFSESDQGDTLYVSFSLLGNEPISWDPVEFKMCYSVTSSNGCDDHDPYASSRIGPAVHVIDEKIESGQVTYTVAYPKGLLRYLIFSSPSIVPIAFQANIVTCVGGQLAPIQVTTPLLDLKKTFPHEMPRTDIIVTPDTTTAYVANPHPIMIPTPPAGTDTGNGSPAPRREETEETKNDEKPKEVALKPVRPGIAQTSASLGGQANILHTADGGTCSLTPGTKTNASLKWIIAAIGMGFTLIRHRFRAW